MVAQLLLVISCVLGCLSPRTYWETVQPIVNSMSLAEQIGQMTQIDAFALSGSTGMINPANITAHNLGSILASAICFPDGEGHLSVNYLDESTVMKSTFENWKDLSSRLNVPISINSTYKVYPLLGTDAVHGNQHVLGETIFPHNIGIAATHNPYNFFAAGNQTQYSVKNSGWNYAFTPTVAVSHNFYWGRHYETMGADPDLIKDYAEKFFQGLQQNFGSKYFGGVLGSAKHFIGDGATYWGIDEGNATVNDYTSFLDVNLAGYIGGNRGCMGSVMVSYSAVNKISMAINNFLVDGVLKRGIYSNSPFDGFVISDFDAISKVTTQGWPGTNIKMDLKTAIITMINAGIDVMMLSSFNQEASISTYQDIVKEAVEENAISSERIKDAVTRILAVKCEMGLISGIKGCAPLRKEVKTAGKSSSASIDALKIAQESLVLLKNKNTLLPVNMDNLKYIVLTGERDMTQYGRAYMIKKSTYRDYDNIGAQCGGWTVTWQGYNGNWLWTEEYKKKSGASSIVESLQDVFDGKIFYNNYTDNTNTTEIAEQRAKNLESIKTTTDMNAGNTLIIGVLAENPYAEYMGDINNPFCYNETNFVEGCNYNFKINQYMLYDQKTSLDIDFEDNSYQVINAVKEKDPDIPFVTVLLSGRPMSINNTLTQSDAFIAAWLPGTAGGKAIVSSINGDYLFRSDLIFKTNTLPVAWIKDESALKDYPIYQGGFPSIKDPLFPIGYGLETSNNN